MQTDQQEGMSGLRECPLCGLSAFPYSGSDGKYVECLGPRCTIRVGPYGTRTEANDTWNTRTPPAGEDGWRPIAELDGDLTREVLCWCEYTDEPPQALLLHVFEVGEYTQVTHFCELPAPPAMRKGEQ